MTMNNIATLANLHSDFRANEREIRATNATIAADVVAAQKACATKKAQKEVTTELYAALRAAFGVSAKATMDDLRKQAAAARDADKENAGSVRPTAAGKALAKRSEAALLFVRAYNALAQAVSRARKEAGLTAASKAADADASEGAGEDGPRGDDASPATAESIAKGLASMPAALVAEAIGLLPSEYQSAIALAIDS